MSEETAEMDGLEGIETRLEQAERRLLDKRKALREQSGQTDSELRRIQSARRALGCAPASSRSRTGRVTRALKTQEVVAMINSVLATDDSLAVQELRSRVEENARSAGHTLIGFHLRFAKALKHERFHVINGQCRLAEGTGFAHSGTKPA